MRLLNSMFASRAHAHARAPSEYPLQLDTGSSDLWVKGDTSPLPNTNQTVSVSKAPQFVVIDRTYVFQALTLNITVSVFQNVPSAFRNALFSAIVWHWFYIWPYILHSG